jgi:hypothetical protein
LEGDRGEVTLLRHCAIAPFTLPMTESGSEGIRNQGIGESGNQGSGNQESARLVWADPEDRDGIRDTVRADSLIPDSLIPDSLIPDSPIPSSLLLGGVLLLSAWLRWRYITHVQPNPDEFVTLLAVKMILQKGLPLLPSGLFYEHGLLFSYAGAVASALFGFSREAVRATSLLFGLLTIWLTWYVGWRWFSPGAGLLAATLLAVTPAAVMWGGRARMYTMLQWLVLLTLYFAFYGAFLRRFRWRWLALACYLGATLTQFVSITLIPPLILGMVAVGWLGRPNPPTPFPKREGGDSPPRVACPCKGGEESLPWFRSREIWLEVAGLVLVALIAFLVKRAGQPKGIAPLGATGTGVVSGIAQVVAIYAALSTDLAGSWRALAPFFTAPAAILPAGLALLATGWAGANLLRRRVTLRDLPTLFLALILVLTTLEMLFFVSPERRDDKYLFMLQPALFLLAADGLTRLGKRISESANQRISESANQRVSESANTQYAVRSTQYATRSTQHAISNLQSPLAYPPGQAISTLIACLALIAYTWPATSALLANTGPDYDTAFGYVRDRWQVGDAVLTGTPAAAAIYLGRNDYYAVRGTGGYAYRILQRDGEKVDRWMGSPWLETDEEIHAALSGSPRVWLVLERWGLIEEYYSPLTLQRILAMTDFVREDNGMIVLRSRPAASLIPENPSVRLSVDFDHQLSLEGYDLSPGNPGQEKRELGLVLYWKALSPLPYDYTAFVHLRDDAGHNVAQADHQPLAPVYPPTLWPVGQTIRERSILTLLEEVPAGTYSLWVGLYRLDTLERLPIVDDRSGENAVLLGQVVVP